MTNEAKFATKLGAILATAAGAVGLGNIWKFPYMAGSHGGGAFLLVYIGCVCVFGLPMMMAELLVGKQTGQGAFNAFRTLSGNRRWSWIGYVMVFTNICLAAFYFVVTGWCLYYLVQTICGNLVGLENAQYESFFGSFLSQGWVMAVFGVITLLITAGVLLRGISKGVEAVSKYMIPALLVIFAVLIGFVLMLPGSSNGLQFFFKPDFSVINPRLVLAALGQCFFSLSIGAGMVLTYGAYMPKNQKLIGSSIQVVTLDTLMALLAGIVIFPAVFALGFAPTEGPSLVFIVLPAVFSKMSMPLVMCLLFFLLLSIAALTSTITIMEMPVSFFTEALRCSRRKSIMLVGVILLIAIVACAFSMTNQFEWLMIGDFNMFDLLDHITSCFLLPLTALVVSVFLGWVSPKTLLREQFKTENGISWFYPVFLFLIRYLNPLIIFIIFLNGVGLFVY